MLSIVLFVDHAPRSGLADSFEGGMRGVGQMKVPRSKKQQL